jgi:hypothetical protein
MAPLLVIGSCFFGMFASTSIFTQYVVPTLNCAGVLVVCGVCWYAGGVLVRCCSISVLKLLLVVSVRSV